MKRYLLAAAVVVASTLALVAPASGAPGDLDPTYGSGGSVDVSRPGAPENGRGAKDAVLQADGKLVVTIFTYEGFIVRRFLPDGSRDEGFGDGGTATMPFDFDWEDAPNGGSTAVAVQPDGKIVVVGQASFYCWGTAPPSCADPLDNPGRRTFAVARFTADGFPDRSFGSPYGGFTGESTGSVRTFFDGRAGLAQAVVIQPDGKIVAAGYLFGLPPTRSVAVARYNPDGSPDATFGRGGTVTTTVEGFTAQARSVMLQPDGKIVVAGRAGGSDEAEGTFLLARYNADGSADPSFGNDGVVTTSIEKYSGAAGAVLRPDGRIVAAGSTSPASDSPSPKFALVGYKPDGSLDPGFGDHGTVTTVFGTASGAGPLVLLPDGTLVAAGSTSSDGSPRMMALVHYAADGSPGTGFGDDGRVSAGSSSGADGASALVLQSDGKLIAVGQTVKRFLGTQGDPGPEPEPDPVPDPEPAPGPTPNPAPGGVAPDTGGAGDGASAPPLSAPSGYWMVDAGGAVYPFGDARHHGAPTLGPAWPPSTSNRTPVAATGSSTTAAPSTPTAPPATSATPAASSWPAPSGPRACRPPRRAAATGSSPPAAGS